MHQVHSRGKALAKDVDFDKIARRTPGFTGADLQNLMNEAAILAARRDLKEISKDEISDALERIIAGPEKKNAVVSEEKKKLVAYHGKSFLQTMLCLLASCKLNNILPNSWPTSHIFNQQPTVIFGNTSTVIPVHFEQK
jgi:ATP-dependent Zn protease